MANIKQFELDKVGQNQFSKFFGAVQRDPKAVEGQLFQINTGEANGPTTFQKRGRSFIPLQKGFTDAELQKQFGTTDIFNVEGVTTRELLNQFSVGDESQQITRPGFEFASFQGPQEQGFTSRLQQQGETFDGKQRLDAGQVSAFENAPQRSQKRGELVTVDAGDGRDIVKFDSQAPRKVKAASQEAQNRPLQAVRSETGELFGVFKDEGGRFLQAINEGQLGGLSPIQLDPSVRGGSALDQLGLEIRTPQFLQTPGGTPSAISGAPGATPTALDAAQGAQAAPQAPSSIGDLFRQGADAVASQPSTLERTQQLREQFKVPELEQGLINAVRNLNTLEAGAELAPEQVQNATKDFFVNANQLQGLTNLRLSEFAKATNALNRHLTLLNTQLGFASDGVKTFLAADAQDQARVLQEIDLRIKAGQSDQEAAADVLDRVDRLAKEERDARFREREVSLKERTAEASLSAPIESEFNEILSVTEATALGVPFGTTKGEAFGKIPKSELTGVEKFAAETKLGQQFAQIVGEPKKALQQIDLMSSSLRKAESDIAAGKSINAASQGVLVTFQKVLDPTSVVRESEYARSGAGQSLLSRISGFVQKLESGGAGVTIEGLREFVSTADAFADGYKSSIVDEALRFKNAADRQGLDLDSIITPRIRQLLDEDTGSGFTTILDIVNRGTREDKNAFQRVRLDNPDATPEQQLEIFNAGRSLTNDLSASVNRSNVSGIKDGTQVQTLMGSGTATGIVNGSGLWKPGFDFVLSGGKGADVPSPVSGKVTLARNVRGFGNQIRVETPGGESLWISHLDGFSVKPGDTIQQGQILGQQGNSGNVLGGSGESLSPKQIASGRGTHLDITLRKAGRSDSTKDLSNFFTSQEVASFLNTRKV